MVIKDAKALIDYIDTGKLNDYERSFVIGVSKRVQRGFPLTEAQGRVLQDIYRKKGRVV